MTDCSYTASNGTSISRTCAGQYYCCTGSDLNFCSSTPCSSSSTSEDSLPVLFWGILGGLFAVGIIMIAVTYIICRFRSPNSCMKDYTDDDILDSHTVTSQRRRSSLFVTKYFMRRESIWRLKTRRKSQLTVKVHGTHLGHATTSISDIRPENIPKNGGLRVKCGTGGGGYKNSTSDLPEVVD